MVPCIGRVPTPWVWNHRNREAQIFFEHLRVWHVGWYFSKYVVIVPAIDKSHLFASVAKRAYHEVHRNHLTEVADMHGARRGNPRSAGIAFSVSPLGYDFFCGLIRPM
uniref:Uncharacterized protein n=1 Tax=wastewater metagenome TaxID=527639 RepID=A0A0A8KXQ4_9ZZZZ